MNWLLSQVAQTLGARMIGADVALTAVSTDTRGVAAGQLFIALRGARFDAHDFLDQAVASGAAALLVALGRLAAAWRAQFSLPLIAVTGSNGKTTTKEMIAAILKAQFGDAVLATRGNFNNDIGLPITLLGLNATHRAAVIEMGMNHPGEIAYLAPIGAPTVALVTNAQRAHLEGMGDLDEVAREKGSVFVGMPANGVVHSRAAQCPQCGGCCRGLSRRRLAVGSGGRGAGKFCRRQGALAAPCRHQGR